MCIYLGRWVYCNVRMDDKQCMLVIIGTTKNGRKELIALEGGYRENENSWSSILVDLRRRGLLEAPELATNEPRPLVACVLFSRGQIAFVSS
jgi:transposase-like protein